MDFISQLDICSVQFNSRLPKTFNNFERDYENNISKSYGPFAHAVLTFMKHAFSILIGIFLLKSQHTVLYFYLGLK